MTDHTKRPSRGLGATGRTSEIEARARGGGRVCLRLRHPTDSIVPDPWQADNGLLLPSNARNLWERPVPAVSGPPETGPWAAGSPNLPIGTVGRP